MKLKKLLTEAFEGMGGIVTLKPLNGNKGYNTSPKQKVNETLPAFAKEWQIVWNENILWFLHQYCL